MKRTAKIKMADKWPLFRVFLWKSSWFNSLVVEIYLKYLANKGFVNIQFQLFPFFKWILKILTKIRCSVKKKCHLLFPAIANLQIQASFFGSKICICFHYASLNFHIFSNVFINTHKYKVFCEKEKNIAILCCS